MNSDEECNNSDYEYSEDEDSAEAGTSSVPSDGVGNEYVILTPQQVRDEMLSIMEQVTNVIQLPPTTSRTLLNHFNWDSGKLLEAYFIGDVESMLKKANITSPLKTSNELIHLKQEDECHICYAAEGSEVMMGMDCGHRFCQTCWTEYLRMKIFDDGISDTLTCAAHNCDTLISDHIYEQALTDPLLKQRYEELLVSKFVAKNKTLRWCPSPDCSKAVKLTIPQAIPVTCSCGTTFCFSCESDWHEPIRCDWLKRWLKKCSDDSETSNWIMANTKECPECDAIIEKNGGCNHMTCKNRNCMAEFCWLCSRPWTFHSQDVCNRFIEPVENPARSKSRAELERYLFYNNRYIGHMQSLKFEAKLREKVCEKIEEMQKNNIGWMDVQFLKTAVDVLCACRQTLMYTFPFAYFLKGTNESVIFEDNQSDLQTATEQLSEYLEQEIEPEQFAELRREIQDKYRYCEKRRKVLVDHVQEGYEDGIWD